MKREREGETIREEEGEKREGETIREREDEKERDGERE